MQSDLSVCRLKYGTLIYFAEWTHDYQAVLCSCLFSTTKNGSFFTLQGWEIGIIMTRVTF